MEKNQEYIEKLRKSGLRPTKQRIKICDVLFNRESTFHFSISDLTKQIQNTDEKTISLATVYNTVHAFKKKGYLKEITINEAQSYFDTNTSEHHHFFDEKEKKLIDIEDGESCCIFSSSSLSKKHIFLLLLLLLQLLSINLL